MDVFYEESALAQDSAKGARKYKIVNIISYVCLAIGVIFLFSCLMNIPFGGSGEGAAALGALAAFCGIQCVFFIGGWFLLSRLKARYNVSYDYCFVSGELRISKVFNINRRKLITRFDVADMLQIGDVENSAFDRLSSDPTTKTVYCSPNVEPSEGKFFMYILIEDNGKKLYVLECRETLLLQIMKFAKRSVLESDYVAQEKKRK